MSFPSLPSKITNERVTFEELCKLLDERPHKVRYWANMLQEEGLIQPKRALKRYIYSQEDAAQFRKLQKLLSDGVETATDAIRLMKNNIDPAQAITRYEHAQRQIEVLQKKVLQLRKPFWKKLVDWIKSLLSGVLSPRTE